MQLLEIVESLCHAPPRVGSRPELTTERVEDALDVALRGDPDNGNRFLYILRSFRAAPPIDSVELRMPLRGATRKGPLCVIELANSPAANDPRPELEEVARAFGEPSRTIAPRGFGAARRGARSRESFLVYDRSWGALRFGATTPSGERTRPVLTTIVIDIER